MTQTVLQDQFGGFKLKGRDHERLQIAKQLGGGSLEAATLVLQVYHWKFVGRPCALTSYRSVQVVNVLTSMRQRHLRLLRSMIAVHGADKAFEYCTYRSEKESRH